MNLTGIPREVLLELPALPPPQGVKPNFINPSSLRDECNAIITLLLIVSTVSVMIRLYAKRYIAKGLAFEDCKLSKSSMIAMY